MSKQPGKAKPEIPQPRPDIVLPDGNDVADFGAHPILRMPSPRNEVYQQSSSSQNPAEDCHPGERQEQAP